MKKLTAFLLVCLVFHAAFSQSTITSALSVKLMNGRYISLLTLLPLAEGTAGYIIPPDFQRDCGGDTARDN